LVVRVGGLVDAIVVHERTAVADPVGATEHLEEACSAAAVPCDTAALQCAMQIAAPLVRERLNAVQNSRWRAADRDQLARRLIPWVLSAARRAARRGDSRRLDALDAVVSRLAQGMTAGEELSLNDVLSRRSALTAGALCDWHAGLPPLRESATEAGVELVAALALQSQ
jgi:hypothetical protein